MIENIKAGERITQAVLLRLQKVGNSSNGGVFARGTIEDNSGRIQFIAFDRDIVNRLRDLDAPKAFMLSRPGGYCQILVHAGAAGSDTEAGQYYAGGRYFQSGSYRRF